MVTQATAEQTTKRGRGRPPRNYQANIQPKAPLPKEGDRGTEFQRLLKAYQKDTLIRGYANIRRKLFNEGEPLDQITASIKRRIADLQAKGVTH